MAEVILRHDWAMEELTRAEFGDIRLKKRGIKILQSFSANPQTSIPAALPDWTDCYAAYRFFDNDKVSHEKILDAHAKATVERMAQQRIVLVVQDTSSLNYSTLEACQGLGNVGDSAHRDAQGLIVHTSYAITPERIPLGILDQKIWGRQKSAYSQNTNARRKAPIADKESSKWLNATHSVSAKTAGLPNTEIIHVMDREADIFELFSEAKHLRQSYIVRSRHNRKINKASRASHHDGDLLLEKLHDQTPAATVELEVNSRGGIDASRLAKVQVRILRFSLTAPKALPFDGRDIKYEKLDVTALSVTEIEADDIDAPIDWVLLTNVEINSAEEALICVDYYCCRWQIEVFHRILKTGCRVEECRFSSSKKIEAFAAIQSIVAWRLHWLSIFSRLLPKGNADVLFSEKEQKILSMIVDKKRPRKNLKIHDYVILLARLGGFLARKHDGNPGPEVLWRGWQKLRDFITNLEHMEELTCGTYV